MAWHCEHILSARARPRCSSGLGPLSSAKPVDVAKSSRRIASLTITLELPIHRKKISPRTVLRKDQRMVARLYLHKYRGGWATVFDLHQLCSFDKVHDVNCLIQSYQLVLLTEIVVQLLPFFSLLPALLAASAALAADADNGKRLAEMRCVTCHIVSPSERRDVTDAPPFEAIARKFASNPDALAFSIMDPHPRTT